VPISSITGNGGRRITRRRDRNGVGVTLIAPATDPTGYVFSYWTLDGVSQKVGQKALSFTMTAPRTAVAVLQCRHVQADGKFERRKRRVHFELDGAGWDDALYEILHCLGNVRDLDGASGGQRHAFLGWTGSVTAATRPSRSPMNGNMTATANYFIPPSIYGVQPAAGKINHGWRRLQHHLEFAGGGAQRCHLLNHRRGRRLDLDQWGGAQS